MPPQPLFSFVCVLGRGVYECEGLVVRVSGWCSKREEKFGVFAGLGVWRTPQFLTKFEISTPLRPPLHGGGPILPGTGKISPEPRSGGNCGVEVSKFVENLGCTPNH